jgi:hypothetical protein
VNGESSGIVPPAAGVTFSGVSECGARPDPLKPARAPAAGSQTIAKRSPPRPHDIGSISARAALTAIAASTAEPPRLSTSTPMATASGCAAATIPWRATVTERVAK